LRQSLWVDFNRYSYAHFDQGKQLLYFRNELGEKKYTITDTQFITEKDRFDIQLASKLFYFNNQKKTTGEIDAIELKTSKETGYQHIFVFKDNAPATYINQQP